MLSCNSCMKRCLQTVIGDGLQLLPAPSRRFGAHVRRYARRNYSSEPNTELRPWTNLSVSEESSHQETRADDKADRKKISREEWIASRGVRPLNKAPKPSPSLSDFAVKKHLTYLKDPVELADFVLRTLRDDEFENAEQVVRAASKSIQCTVSWNHLVDWQLSKGRMNAAIKTYNEMKKRAQVPDAHTYTIIFNGCAEHPDSNQALTKVLAIYHSMHAENSPVKPNVTHMNCVLKMCAKARNMDAMFGIAGQMPRRGFGSPNKMTYTTIINALRMHAIGDFDSTFTGIEKRKSIQQAILNARYVWRDVVSRWRRGEVWIDEDLVCAMGRLLAIGEKQDMDDVLSLFEQTMDIPRPASDTGNPAPSEIQSVDHEKQDDTEWQSGYRDSGDELAGGQSLGLEQFKSAKPPVKPNGVDAYATPGRNALSLLMRVLLELRLIKPAVTYWRIFTEEKNVKPDEENYNAYLRILRVARASTEVVKLLLKMQPSRMTHSTFRIAIAACDRDKNNHHSFANAGKVLDLMQSALSQPDVKVLESYLNVAVNSAPSHETGAPGYQTDDAKAATGAQILRALNRLNPSLLNLRAYLSFSRSDSRSPKVSAEAEDVLRLIQRMIGAYDLLMNNGLVPREKYSVLMKERSKLAAFVTRFKHRKIAPVLPKRGEKVPDISTKAESYLPSPKNHTSSMGSPLGQQPQAVEA